jgi:release factor glutamine methyltransferase
VLNGGTDALKIIMNKENIAAFSAVVSNPPYIPTDVISTLEPELFFEPKMALDGGADGLVFYRNIIQNYYSFVAEGGYMLFEIGADQADCVRTLCDKKSDVIRDLGGNDRVVKIAF